MPCSLKYKWLYSVFFVVVAFYQADAQQLKRATIGTLGGSVSNEDATIQYTVGQPSMTVNSIAEKSALRSGFQQPFAQLAERLAILNLHIYPNPTSSMVNIETTFKGDESIYIIDAKGGLVHEFNVTAPAEEFSIDVKNLASGPYTLILKRGRATIGFAKLMKL